MYKYLDKVKRHVIDNVETIIKQARENNRNVNYEAHGLREERNKMLREVDTVYKKAEQYDEAYYEQIENVWIVTYRNKVVKVCYDFKDAQKIVEGLNKETGKKHYYNKYEIERYVEDEKDD